MPFPSPKRSFSVLEEKRTLCKQQQGSQQQPSALNHAKKPLQPNSDESFKSLSKRPAAPTSDVVVTYCESVVDYANLLSRRMAASRSHAPVTELEFYG